MPLLLHDDTRAQLRDIVEHPPQALIITGQRGIGKTSIVAALASQLLGADPATHRYYKSLDASQGIAAVRELQSFMSLHTVGEHRVVDRIAVIEQADQLSIEAENALLKLLEEPPAGAMLILVTSQPQTLLPTIHSRSQVLAIAKPPAANLQDYFTQQGIDAPQVAQAIQLGQGLPGTVTALLGDDPDNIIRQAVEQARAMLRATSFERLTMIDGLAKKKPLAVETLRMLCQMAEASLRQLAQVRPDDADKRTANWQQIFKAAFDAEKRLEANGQAKLVLTDCVLSLP